jgi:cytoskeletal protein CcmA (bactofilin family)|tara:strand:+ start:19030 stop:19452 length:423 start_codon:yes stop_codon:yes gene_type:complete
MFTEFKKEKNMSTSSNQQNMITQGTSFVGDLISEAGFRIEGNVSGTIKTSGKVVVGKTGVINGTLEGVNADFEGGFSGKLKLSGTLTLKASAYVEGEVEVVKLAVEPGATFNASCSMKGGVKELNKGEQQKITSKTEKTA